MSNKITLPEFVVKRINELCEERHMSKYRLCQLTGIAQSSLSTIANGKTLPSIITLARLCEGLGISIFDFFERDGVNAVVTKDEQVMLKYWRDLDDTQKKMLTSFAKGIIAANELRV